MPYKNTQSNGIPPLTFTESISGKTFTLRDIGDAMLYFGLTATEIHEAFVSGGSVKKKGKGEFRCKKWEPI